MAPAANAARLTPGFDLSPRGGEELAPHSPGSRRHRGVAEILHANGVPLQSPGSAPVATRPVRRPGYAAPHDSLPQGGFTGTEWRHGRIYDGFTGISQGGASRLSGSADPGL